MAVLTREEFNAEYGDSLVDPTEQARYTLSGAMSANPEEEAKIQKLAKDMQVPVPLARNSYEEMKKFQAFKQMNTSPATSKLFSDRDKARLAHDDVENLVRTENILTNVTDIGQSFGAGLVTDFFGNVLEGLEGTIARSQYGSMSELQSQTGGNELAESGVVSEKDKEDLKVLSKGVKEAGEAIDIPEERRGRMRNQIARGVGQVIGQLAAVAGTGGAGSLFLLGMQGAGAMESSLAEDRARLAEQGKDIDVAAEQAVFLGGAAVTALTEKFGLDFIAGKYTPALVKFVEKYGSAGLMRLIENRGVQYGLEVALGGLAEGTQEVSEDIGQAALRKALIDNSVSLPTADELFTTFAVSGAVGLLTGAGVNARTLLKSRADQRRAQALKNVGQESKVNDRNPAIYQDHVKEAASNSGIDTAYVDRNQWNTYYQSKGLDPEAAAERYGITNYKESGETGSYLEMPIERYVSQFVKSDAFPSLEDHLKTSSDPEVLTPYEAAQVMADQERVNKKLQETLAEMTPNRRASLENTIDSLIDDITPQLNARFNDSTSRTQATLLARMMAVTKMRDELSRNPNISEEEVAKRIRQEWQDYGLIINANVQPDVLTKRRTVNIELDPWIERIRKGDFPKEKDIYGRTLSEQVRRMGGLYPDEVVREMVKNGELPRSLMNEKGMGADELAESSELAGWSIGDTDTEWGVDRLLEALSDEHAGNPHYSNFDINEALLADATYLDNLEKDLKYAGINLNEIQDNAEVRRLLEDYYARNPEEQSETEDFNRYNQAGSILDSFITPENAEEINRQCEEVREQYKDTPLWMKAPNGEQTSLSERDWLLVRTPLFKQQFGDWEKASQKAFLDGEPVVSVDGTFFSTDGTIKPSEKVYNFFQKEENKLWSPIFGDIIFSKRSVKDAFAHHIRGKLGGFETAKDVLQKGVVISQSNNWRGKNIQGAVISAPVEIGGKKCICSIVIRRSEDGHRFYMHDLVLRSRLDNGAKENHPRRNGIPSDRDDIRSVLKSIISVNSEEISVALDKNGEPGSQTNPDVFFQQQEKIRGAFTNSAGQYRIDLFRDANFSTFAHESAHFMLEVLANRASIADASDYSKQEFARICKYLGVKEGQPITREQHEKFARSFEAYLMEGKAPSPELKDIFRRFASWLKSIYRELRNLNVPLSKDIRDVFDRMLATDQEIEVARAISRQSDTLFATAKDMGVSQELFDVYKNLGKDALETAREKVLSRLMRIKKQEQNKEYKEELARVKKQLEKDWQELPAVKAKNTLSDPDSTTRLNRAQLIDRYGKAWPAKLPRVKGNTLYAKKGGIDIDLAATQFGFETGDSMIESIMNLPDQKTWIDAESDRLMKERYKDLLNSDYLPDVAQEALHNEARQEVLLYEMRALQELRKVGDAAIRTQERADRQATSESMDAIKKRINLAKEAAKQYAEDTIDNKAIRQIRPNTWLIAERKASREAAEAIAKKQYDKAEDAKRRELLASMMYSEAMKAKEQMDKAQRLFKRILNGGDQKIAKTRLVNPVYRARYILASHGFGGSPDIWMEKLKTAAKNNDVDADTTAEIQKSWKDMTFSEFKAMTDEVEGLWDLSRLEKTVEVDGKRLEVNDVVGKIKDEFEKFGIGKEYDDSSGFLHDWITSNKRIEHQIEMIAGEDSVFMTHVFQPMKDASIKARLKGENVTERLQQIFNGLKFYKGKIEAPELIGQDNKPHVFGAKEVTGGAELFGLLLHMGNESNLKKLVVGYGWGTVDANGKVDTSRVDALVRRMAQEGKLTKEHFDAAQKIWDIYDELKPESQKANKAIYGVYFKEIKFNGIDTPFGHYKGGYVPAKVDSDLVPTAKDKEIKDVDANSAVNMLAMQQPGFTKERIETYAGKLDLNPRLIVGATERIINYAYIAPVFNDIRKIMNNKTMIDTLARYKKNFREDVIIPWMNRSRLQSATSGLDKPMARRLANFRSRAGAAIMFGNIKNFFQQGADILVGASEVKPSHLMEAVFNHDEEFIMDKSIFMRDRMGKSQRAMLDNIDSILIDAGTLKKADKWIMNHAYYLSQLSDDTMSKILWTAAYNDALSDNKTELQSVRHADRIVRNVMMSQNPEDVSNVEAGSSFMRLFTQFSGFFVNRSNRVFAGLGRLAREAGAKGTDSNTTKALKILGDKKMKVLLLLVANLAVSPLVETAIQEALAGRFPDDDKWARNMFAGSVNYVAGLGGPWANIVGDIATDVGNIATGGKAASNSMHVVSSPLFSLLEDLIPHAYSLMKGDVTAEKILKFTGDLSIITPIPVVPKQIVNQATYLTNVATNKVRPTGPVDFVRGAITGKASDKSKRK